MKNIIANHKFRELLLPTILIAMALNITAIVDSFFVSSFIGDTALSAIQLLEPIILLITVFEWLFGLGGQILSLNKKAEFDEEGSNHYFTVAIITTIVLCIIFIIICATNTDRLISMLHAEKEIVPYVKQYAPYLFLSFPLSALLGVISQYIRVDGQPNLSSAVIIIANIINIVLDYIFLAHLHTGIAGASLATLIGYTVGLLCVLKYHFDPKRTFKFIQSIIPLKKWITSVWEICKIGFPSAAMGFFDVILVYAMNALLVGTLGKNGLVAYTVSTESLLVISIIIIGIADTLTSIIPLYYTQEDYLNVSYLTKRSTIFALILAVIYTAFFWIWPEGFLTLYNLNNASITPILTNALRLYSLFFIPSVIATILIFYYEAIERAKISTVISVIVALVGPLAISYSLYPVYGINIVWLSFPISCIISIVIATIYAKLIERNEPEYSGIFFIKKDIIKRSEHYLITSEDDKDKTNLINHLKSLNIEKEHIDCITTIISHIYRLNNTNIPIEVVLIDYDDKIKLYLRDEGKDIDIDEVKKEISYKDNINYTLTLGLNNIEYTIDKN